jgi:hypothetical protein
VTQIVPARTGPALRGRLIQAWHLTGATLRDGRAVPPVGEWLEHEGALELCEAGLHASERLIDALRYAPAGVTTIHRVECDGDVIHCDSGDKFAGRRRRIVASYPFDLRRVVRLACESAALAAWCTGLYLPELIVAAEAADRGDFAAASAAAAAAGDARGAGDAARAARDASWAADATARAAAGAVWAAARGAAWAAGDATAWAASDVVDAAWAAAGDAGDAAWSAARDAAWETLEARAVALLTGGAL